MKGIVTTYRMIKNPEKEAIVKAINDLYILHRWKYLILNKEGKYNTITYYKNNPPVEEEGKFQPKPLSDWMVYHHINGKHTLGVFAGQSNGVDISKFITFDVDVGDKKLAEWTVYRIVHILQDIGIEDEYRHISSSGNKGYHIDIFFSTPIEVWLLYQFYTYILTEADLISVDFGKVEFRPTGTQGIKIPLGINFRNKDPDNNKCYFVEYSKGLKEIKDPMYITKIKKLDTILFRLILDKILDLESEETSNKNIIDYKYIKKEYTPPKQYDKNVDISYTVESIQKLLTNGLNRTGSRHDSLLYISKYYRHLGLPKEDNKDYLIQWIEQQDKTYYTTKWSDILKDIDEIVKYVYNNNFSLVGGVNKVEVTYTEMKEILKAKNKNEKLVLYSMLIHSKRYAIKSGVFYMAYSLIEKATTLTRKTLIKIVTKLEEDGFIEIVSRNKNRFNNGNFAGKETNKYKVTLNIIEKENELMDDKVFNVDREDNYIESFNKCLLNFYNNKEIKQLLSVRHYTELMLYKNNKSNIKV